MPFEPKEKIELDPPEDRQFTVEELAKYDGKTYKEMYIAIKGVVFDVTRNQQAYGPGSSYNLFVGKEASIGLAKSSLNPEDLQGSIDDLTPEELGVLNDWFTFFSKRYNIKGNIIV
ncbi:hypothetical protein CANCADRAFT_27975 [Tortispora caseinolytica NRRL Y-17796]|uniref:Cytochrome b5 heme-binding domain-containing protein n=1 Tax=Tortispora caseinolytica NRRL Y-17796 TaxID=767744 RepID=A0A1E4TAE5_9ASCO|nr:hypothetical protein CANCADRAFT_27975 [Tortispora caseinolytica NRRL Y-17796]